MSPRTGDRLTWASGAAAAMLIAASASAAQAQTCVASDEAVTSCKLVLSRPRNFTVQGVFRPQRGNPGAAQITISVNGRPCSQLRYGLFSRNRAACHVALPAGLTRIEADAAGRGRVKVEVIGDDRLAALPREADSLDPERNGFWARLWPF